MWNLFARSSNPHIFLHWDRMAGEWTPKKPDVKGLVIVHFPMKLFKKLWWTCNRSTSICLSHSISSENDNIVRPPKFGGGCVHCSKSIVYDTWWSYLYAFTLYEQTFQILCKGQHSSYQEENNNLNKFELFIIVVQIWQIFVIKPNQIRPNLFFSFHLLFSPHVTIKRCWCLQIAITTYL